MVNITVDDQVILFVAGLRNVCVLFHWADHPPLLDSSTSRFAFREEFDGERSRSRNGSGKIRSRKTEAVPPLPNSPQEIPESAFVDSYVEYCYNGMYNVTFVLFIT